MWLQNVVERRSSKEELDWLKLMGVDCENGVEAKDRICYEEIERLRCLKLNVEPDWYQELSDRQMDGLRGLYDAVRDDYDLRETKRISDVLQHLGLHPMPPLHLIQRAVNLSLGHELAFLWFLLDVWYLTFHNYKPDRGKSMSSHMNYIFELQVSP